MSSPRRRFLCAACTSMVTLGGCHLLVGVDEPLDEPRLASLVDGGNAQDGGGVGQESGVSVDAADMAACAKVDVQRDPHNCGACGHDCLGGACEAARCAPVELFRVAGNASYLTLASDALYGTDRDPWSLFRWPLDAAPGSSPTTLVGDADQPTVVTVDDARVYWTSQAASGPPGVRSARRSDGADVQTLVSNLSQPIGLYRLGAELFATDYEKSRVLRVATAGGAVADIYMGAGTEGQKGIVVDAAHVFWTEMNTQRVMRANLDGSARTVLDSAPPSVPRELAIDDQSIYVLAYQTGTVARYDKATGARLVLASAQGTGVGTIVVDADFVYWAAETDGAVRYTRKSGGVVKTLYTGAGPRSVVTDGRAIYVAEAAGKRVLRIARPLD